VWFVVINLKVLSPHCKFAPAQLKYEKMINKQETWFAMILSGYAKKLGIAISEAAERLMSDGGLNYMEDCYEALHTQSNEDVINELLDMAKTGAAK